MIKESEMIYEALMMDVFKSGRAEDRLGLAFADFYGYDRNGSELTVKLESRIAVWIILVRLGRLISDREDEEELREYEDQILKTNDQIECRSIMLRARTIFDKHMEAGSLKF